MTEPNPAQDPKPKKSAMVIGFTLMGLSGVFFFTMLSVPWFPFSTTVRSVLGGTLFALTQGSWWLGVAMLGPTAIRGLKKRFGR